MLFSAHPNIHYRTRFIYDEAEAAANAAHCKKIPGNSQSCSRDLNTI